MGIATIQETIVRRNFKLMCYERAVARTHNIRLNEIKKRRALFGNQTVVLLRNSGALSKCLPLIPSFFYFVNPFFVSCNCISDLLTFN